MKNHGHRNSRIGDTVHDSKKLQWLFQNANVSTLTLPLTLTRVRAKECLKLNLFAETIHQIFKTHTQLDLGLLHRTCEMTLFTHFRLICSGEQRSCGFISKTETKRKAQWASTPFFFPITPMTKNPVENLDWQENRPWTPIILTILIWNFDYHYRMHYAHHVTKWGIELDKAVFCNAML